jgi:hypothetical protein
MTPKISEDLAFSAGSCGLSCSDLLRGSNLETLQNTPDHTASWILFPDKAIGWGSFEKLQGLIPKGYEFPLFSDAVHCFFMKSACMKTDYPAESLNKTCCKETVYWVCSSDNHLIVSDMGRSGVQVGAQNAAHIYAGVAPLRKFPCKVID